MGTSVLVLKMLMLLFLMPRMTASGMVSKKKRTRVVQARIPFVRNILRTTGMGINVPIGHGSIVIPEIVEVDDEPVLIVI